MDKRIFGEFMGTMVLILMGNGVVANVLLRKSKAEGAGWMVIATGWALAVMCGVFTAVACGSADAHLNPAVTLASAIGHGRFQQALALYVAAQIAGRVLPAQRWCGSLSSALARDSRCGRKLACFCTAPAIRRPAANLVSEIIGTFVLVLVASAIARRPCAAPARRPGLAPTWWAAWCGALA